LPVLETIAAAVDAAHQAGILHRDLKPGNVLLSPSVKVLDFGLAQLVATARSSEAPPHPTGGSAAAADPRLTETGTLLGTPLYVAPEVIRDPRAASPASDIYSFAALAYEVLAGRSPFAGTTSEVLQAHLHQAPPPAPLALLPEGAREALQAGLAKEPSARPRRARELVDRIEEACRRA